MNIRNPNSDSRGFADSKPLEFEGFRISPGFNSLEFEGIKNEAGRNSFFLSTKKWIERTGARGLIASAGRYGGTFAHLRKCVQCSQAHP
jgi:hypothetical protein